MEHLYNMKCKNKVPLYDLLLEMLDAHRLHSPAKVTQTWAQADGEPPSTTTTLTSTGPSTEPTQGQDAQLRGSGSGILHYGIPRSDRSTLH